MSVLALAGAVWVQIGGWTVVLPLGTSPAAAQEFCANDSTGQEQRTVIFENRCDSPVWIGFVGGSVACTTDGATACPTSTSTCVPNEPNSTGGSCTCKSNTDCGTGQACNTDAGYCFWTMPTPTYDNGTQGFQLDAVGSSGPKQAKSCLPQRSELVQLSGSIFGRTGCVTNASGLLTCQTAPCQTESGSQACLPGSGGTPPATQVEFTFQNSFSGANNKDFYDVTIINGANVSMAMRPIADTYTRDSSDPYSCQAPGSPEDSSTGLTGCNWKFHPGIINGADQAALLRLVNPEHVTSASECPPGSTYYSQTNVCLCTTDSQCSGASSGLLCGSALGVIGGTSPPPGGLGQACGTTIGEWSADQLCGLNPNFKSSDGSLDCAQTFDLNSTTGTTTLAALLLCPKGGAESCYNDNPVPTTDCCGCATDPANRPYYDSWPTVLGLGDQCYNNNATWGKNVQNWLAFMKRACPTAYTYPYDDATSTFTCLSNGNHGGVGFRITYCPERGVPASFSTSTATLLGDLPDLLSNDLSNLSNLLSREFSF